MDGKLVELTAQWSTLMKQIGTDVLPLVNGGLSILVSILKGANDFFGWTHGSHLPASTAASVVPQQQKQVVVIDHQTNIDGRAIAQSTTRYQIDGMAKMPSSGNNFDQRATPLGALY